MKLQWHEVTAGSIGTGKYHTLLTVTPENQAAYKESSAFSNKNSEGKSYSSLGAGPESGDLKAGVNRTNDRTPHSGGVVIPTPAQYKNEDQFVSALFQATANFAENTSTPEGALNYSFFPESNKGEYNSNSFVSGLLQSVGAPVPELKNSPPGYKTPVPKENYEKKPEQK